MVFEGTLDGIAADHQPMEMLQRLQQAMQDLGLIDQLHTVGISNSLTRDKQTIVFSMKDQDGRTRQIAAYELSKLGESNAMQVALEELSDLAHDKAPGTSERLRDMVQQQSQTIKKTADKYLPKPEDEMQGA